MNSPVRDQKHNTCNDNSQLEIQDNSSLHHYRTEIPNVIFDLKLDVYEFVLYSHLKQIAGDRGMCFQSNTTLAERIGCGITKLKEAKTSLQERGLITITKRTNPNGGDTSDLIEIVDIWAYNMKTMLQKYGNMGGSPRDGGGSRHAIRGGSPRDHKEELFNKNPSSTKGDESEEREEKVEEDFLKLKDCPIDDQEKQSLLSQFNDEELAYINQLALAQVSQGFKPKTTWIQFLAGAVRRPQRYPIPEVKQKQSIDLEKIEAKRLNDEQIWEQSKKRHEELMKQDEQSY